MDDMTGRFGIGTMQAVFQVVGTVFVEKHVFVVSVVPESEAWSVPESEAWSEFYSGKRGMESVVPESEACSECGAKK